MEKLLNQQETIWVKEELDRICSILEQNMKRFGTDFPSACATNGKYRIKKNDDWTNGFWTGMLWIAYLYIKKDVFKNLACENIKSFKQRLDEHFVLEHHDIGFLYSLSVGAGYQILEDESLKQVLIQAADVLTTRFQQKGGFIQAWGKLDNEKEYRLIIDSLMNLPLLYTAYKLTGDSSYRQKAQSHYQQVIKNIVREDYSTYHTFYFNPKTGEPDHGATHQGFSDQSCWARGQAWAILGMPLHARVSGESFTQEEEKLYSNIVNYFENHLPSDGMPYWDLIFKENSNEPRDSSALAIAACGMLEMKQVGRAKEMLKVLTSQASSKDVTDCEGILLHGVYSYAENKGVDEPNLWGDYFYTEALYRLWEPNWYPYW